MTPALVVNILWLLSLVFALGSALIASSVQEWAETYQMNNTHQTTETERGPVWRPRFTHLVLGEYWTTVVEYISALLIILALGIMRTSLDISIFSFFAGLVVYVWNIHATIGHCVLGFVLILILCKQIVMTAITARSRSGALLTRGAAL
jgi:hypothetical protein